MHPLCMEEIPEAYMINSHSTVALNLCTYKTKKTGLYPQNISNIQWQDRNNVKAIDSLI